MRGRLQFLHVSFLLSLAALAFTACNSPEAPTAIIVRVESSLAIPEELDQLVVFVTVNETTERVYLLGDDGVGRLPLEFAVEPRGSTSSDVDIVVEGWANANLQLTRAAYTTFVPGQRKLLRITLERACVNQPLCLRENETCIGGTCRSGEVDPRFLPNYGGGSDAGMDAARPDSGLRRDGGDASTSNETGAGDSSVVATDVGTRDAGSDAGATTDGGASRCSTPCDDGNFCNGVELCLEGRCIAGTPPICMDSNPCTRDACSATGCTFTPDNSLCAAEGMCTQMGCSYPTCTPTNCPATDAATCTRGTCEGSVCRRTSSCMTGEMCCNGACVRAGCDDGNVCTSDACGASGCTNTPTPGPCSDGNACSVNDTCNAGSCTPGAARICPETDGTPCTKHTCNASTGECDVSADDTASCSDTLACNGRETCAGGACRPGTPQDCNDNIPCTTDTTTEVPAAGSCGCVNTPNNALCTMEAGGTCIAGTGCRYPNCNTSNCDATAAPCETKTCVNDMCVRTPLCTAGQMCCGNACVVAGCNDGNPCTQDSCNAPASACVNSATTGVGCTGSNPCMRYTCGADGQCHGTNACIEDSDPCTFISCQAGVGCRTSFSLQPCNDNNGCTVNDQCTATGACVGTEDPVAVCNGGLTPHQCVTLTCTNNGGTAQCRQTNRDFERCEDGNGCTLEDRCETTSEGDPVCREGYSCNAVGTSCCSRFNCCGVGLSFNCTCS